MNAGLIARTVRRPIMQRVQSIDKGLDILESVGRHPRGIGTRALAKELGMNITSTHNMAATLKARGYLRQDVSTKQFYLGWQVMVLARNGNLNAELTQAAMPFVHQAAEAIGESVMLAALVDRRIVRVANLASPKALSVQDPEDLSSVAYCTATGKVLLASMASHALDDFLKDIALVKYTPDTIHTLDRIRAELEKVRHQGYATTCDELSEGVSAAAVPIPDPWQHMAAAIGTSAPSIRFDRAARTKALSVLRNAAASISRIWWAHPALPKEATPKLK